MGARPVTVWYRERFIFPPYMEAKAIWDFTKGMILNVIQTPLMHYDALLDFDFGDHVYWDWEKIENL